MLDQSVRKIDVVMPLLAIAAALESMGGALPRRRSFNANLLDEALIVEGRDDGGVTLSCWHKDMQTHVTGRLDGAVTSVPFRTLIPSWKFQRLIRLYAKGAGPDDVVQAAFSFVGKKERDTELHRLDLVMPDGSEAKLTPWDITAANVNVSPGRDDSAEAQSADLSVAALAEGVANARYAMATDDARYYLEGMLVKAQADGLLRIVATDGHRLCRYDAMASVDVADGGPEVMQTILPRVPILLIGKALPRAVKLAGADLCTLRVQGAFASVSVPMPGFDGGLTWHFKAIDGSKYPDVERVWPEVSAPSVTTKAEVLQRLCKRGMAIDADHIDLVRDSGAGIMAAEARVDDDNESASVKAPLGELSEQGRAANWGGDRVRCSAGYVSDVADHLRGDAMVWIPDGEHKALLFNSGRLEHGAACHLIMPMRV